MEAQRRRKRRWMDRAMDDIREKRLSGEEVCDRIRPKQDEDGKRNATWRAKNSGAT